VRINPEKKEDRERVAHTLLRVTLGLADAHGFVSLGLREVSRAAGIAPTSFYRHFADMEELGRELIESLAGPFIDEWIARARAKQTAAGSFAIAIAGAAIASAVEDRELMRFVLAERTGAIPSFRAAVAGKLSVVSAAVENSLGTEAIGAGAPELAIVADAVVALVVSACAEVLDGGADRTAAVTERVTLQIRMLLAGAAAAKARR
jgi:TetR/AcrR family transcriptional regulator, fatty acid biosynthesis regulator